MDTVKLYDPAAPGHCRTELAANFNPERHTRWEYRPSALQVPFYKVVDGMAPPVTSLLHKAGILSAEDVAAAGAEGLVKVKGVKPADAEKLLAWALPLLPPAAEEIEEELDPAITVLEDHQEHEDRQAGKAAEDQEDRLGSEPPAPSAPAGETTTNGAGTSGDSATPAAPSTPAPEGGGNAPSVA